MGLSPLSQGFVVRRVAAGEWREIKAMRLEALQDEAASIAYLETYDAALARPDEFWQERAANASTGEAVAQLVGITDAGAWVGSVTGLRELGGTSGWTGHPIEQDQVHVAGVWVHPDHRGAGVLGRLVAEVVAWSSAQGIERVQLLVHEDNARAQAAYRRLGFARTGVIVAREQGNEVEMVRAGGGAPTQP